ncbi:hypothetical protein VKS41_004999 [Umbelopsis sp. WA50703]
MWVKLICHGRCLTAIEGDKPVYVKGCTELPADQQDSQLWNSDRGFWVNKKTAHVLAVKNDRLKDGESAVQAPRRMIPNAVSQRWDTNGRFIQLRNKKDLVLTVDNETGSISIRKPAQDDDANQQWEQVER